MQHQVIDRAPTFRESSWEYGKNGCNYLPICCLGTMAIGGVGFALGNAFGVAGGLQPINIANIAYEGFAAVAAFFSCACYYKNLPEKAFEDNVNRQGAENIELQKIETQVGQSLEVFAEENKQLKMQVTELEERIKDLQIALEKEGANLVNLTNELNETMADLEKTKENFAKVKETVDSAKNLVISMTETSKLMKSNIKSSKVVVELFKNSNEDFEKEVSHFDKNNVQLSELLDSYSKMISEEHQQFYALMTTCEKLDATCKKLQMDISELSKTTDRFSSEVDRGIHNTDELEKIEKALADLSDDL